MLKSPRQPDGSGAGRARGAFNPPVARAGQIVRSRLVLEAERTRRVVVVRAPAGYGKSTFAAQWCRSDPRIVAWLSLRDADNDAVRLLGRLAVALDPVDVELVAALDRPAPRVQDVLLPRFLDDLTVRVPFQLTLDDVHLINSPSSIGVLKGLADAVPEGSQLVLVSRAEPPISLARLRALGDLYELAAVDLALNGAETAQLLSLAGVHLSSEEVVELWSATEGWAAGLALAAMSRLKGKPIKPFAALTLGRRDIDDYFREEVLELQAEDVRQFLLATSGVQRLCGPLCDAMTGRRDSAELLNELAATNLFVIPLDEDRRWFRYHHLFQALLEAEMEAAGEHRPGDLMSRASAWHEQHGDPAEAFEYARRATDFDRAGRILLRHYEEHLASGRLETVLRWLDRCREEDIESDPQLAISAAWVRSHTGDGARANRYLAAAERTNLDRPSADGASSLRAAMVNLRASLGTRGATQMLHDGLSLVDSELPQRTRRLPAGYRNVGVAHLILGHPSQAIDALNEMLALTETRPQTRYLWIYCLGMLALAHSDLGDWARADRLTRQAEDNVTDLEHIVERLPVLVARSAIAAHVGDRAATQNALVMMRELMPTIRAAPVLEAELSLRGAQAAHGIGDGVTASALGRDADLACRRVRDPGSIPTRIAALRARLADIDPQVALLSPAEKRVLRQLATHRTLHEIAEHLYVSRSTIKTHVAAIYSKLGVTTRAGAVAALGQPQDQRVIEPGDDNVEAAGRNRSLSEHLDLRQR
jgi:LuxR family transcriptional regulator, maltose regulon positive regulatory protein